MIPWLERRGSQAGVQYRLGLIGAGRFGGSSWKRPDGNDAPVAVDRHLAGGGGEALT
jgi:hypothetical protein